MGLGKTLQSISLLAALREVRGITGPHLVLAPKSVLGNWEREFKRFCPSFKVLKLQGQDRAERERLVKEELVKGNYDVVIASYETLIIEKSAFRKFGWYYIVIDEAHRIKNENSALAVEVRRQTSLFRLLLTGTPLQNNLHELWALLNFLLPDIFSSSDDFDSWFATGGSQEVVKKLHAVIKPFLLRRLKIDVERSLLPKIETKLYVGMTVLQRQWYKTILSKDAMALNQIGGTDRVRLLNILMQLRKVCNHPYLFEGAEPGPPYFDGAHIYENAGKMSLVHKLLPKLKAQGSRVLIFCQMTRMLDIMEDYLRMEGVEYCRIDGNTGGEEREDAMEKFNAPGSTKDVFLLSTRAGGLGINLYTADVVILYDSDWNPQADLQAMDRAHRIGQKKQVRVFRLVTDRSVEEKIVERAERKLFLDAIVVQQGRLAPQEKGLSKDALMNMVRFGADDIFRGEGSTITDEDVDAILSKGAEKTRETADKLKSEMAKQLGSMNMEDLFKSDGKFLYDSSTDAGGQIGGVGFTVPIEDRKAKARPVVYAEGGEQARSQAPRPSGPKLLKPPPMLDFQFFQRKRIEEIFARENELMMARKEAERNAKEAKVREARERAAFVRARVAELLEASGSGTALSAASAGAADSGAGAAMDADSGAAAPAESAAAGELMDIDSGALAASSSAVGAAASEARARAEEQAAEEWAARIAAAEPESAAFDRIAATSRLSAEEYAEKERLLGEGFDWSRRDYKNFLSTLEKHGKNREVLLATMRELIDKDEAEISRYYDTFFSRMDELGEASQIRDKMEKAESRQSYREAIERIVAERVMRSPDPMRTLTVPYPQPKAPTSKGYTEEEDRFLICLLNELGYGAWDEMRAEIRRSEQFRFDFFLKSRTPVELSKRCDALIRLLEKDAFERGTPAGREVLAARTKGTSRAVAGGGAVAGAGAGAGAGTGAGAAGVSEPATKKPRKSDVGVGGAPGVVLASPAAEGGATMVDE